MEKREKRGKEELQTEEGENKDEDKDEEKE